MKTLNNDQLLDLFGAHNWEADEVDGRIMVYTCNYVNGVFTEGDIDVTGWTVEQVEDKFGFNEVCCNESTWDINRN